MSHYLITGTDTGVGKTVLSLLLMQYFLQQGKNSFYLKPFQTGCRDPHDEDSDARFIYRHLPQYSGRDPADSVVYCFPDPRAPWFAARDWGATVELEPVIRKLDTLTREHDPVLVEGAGGLLVPLARERLLIDMIPALDAQVILAARPGLGTINHTLLSIEALKRRDIEVCGVVFLASGDCRASQAVIRENREAVERFGRIPVAGVIPHITDFHNPDPVCFSILDSLFDVSCVPQKRKPENDPKHYQ